jgi:hypothetical protein
MRMTPSMLSACCHRLSVRWEMRWCDSYRLSSSVTLAWYDLAAFSRNYNDQYLRALALMCCVHSILIQRFQRAIEEGHCVEYIPNNMHVGHVMSRLVRQHGHPRRGHQRGKKNRRHGKSICAPLTCAPLFFVNAPGLDFSESRKFSSQICTDLQGKSTSTATTMLATQYHDNFSLLEITVFLLNDIT